MNLSTYYININIFVQPNQREIILWNYIFTKFDILENRTKKFNNVWPVLFWPVKMIFYTLRKMRLEYMQGDGADLVVDVGHVLLVGRVADVAEVGRVARGQQDAVPHQRLALARHLVPLQVHLQVAVACGPRVLI